VSKALYFSREYVLNSINVKFQSRSAKDNFRVATTSLELARSAKEGWEIDHHSLAGITFVAFSIEAMLNHFGKIYFSDWNEIKMDRKASHKKLFKEVNLPNYLGSKEYQNAKKCFDLRDMLAHGKTLEETIVVELPEGIDNDEIVREIVSIGSEPHREANYKLLKAFIETALKIEKDIEGSGFYPNQSHIAEEDRSKLSECPLSVSGTFAW
jgi:hypothetical protein